MSKSTEKTPIGKRLRKLRRLRKFSTPKALAEAVNDKRVTESAITNVENGRKTDLTLTEAVLIANTLEVTPLALMFDSFDPFGVAEEYADLDRTNLESLQWAGQDLFFDNMTEMFMKTQGRNLPPLDGFALANALERSLINAEQYSKTADSTAPETSNILAFVMSPGNAHSNDFALLRSNAADARRYLAMCDDLGVTIPDTKREQVHKYCVLAGIEEEGQD